MLRCQEAVVLTMLVPHTNGLRMTLLKRLRLTRNSSSLKCIGGKPPGTRSHGLRNELYILLKWLRRPVQSSRYRHIIPVPSAVQVMIGVPRKGPL